MFLLCVALPTVLASVYYGILASDIFISESRFVVRSPQTPTPSGLIGSLLQGSGFSRTQDDNYTVQDFIRSRDALSRLDQEFGLTKAFSDPKIDFLNRFGALDWDLSFESLYRYYPNRVSVNFDPASGISVLRVSAFTAEDARKINERLLAMSEALANQLSERARQDIVNFAAANVRKADAAARLAADNLAAFRSRNTVVDPEKQSAAQLQGVAKLQEELIAATTQLNQLQTFTPANPQIPALKSRIASLQAAIKSETDKVAGKGADSLTGKAASFERLSLERELTAKQLAVALDALQTANAEAQRKQLYLDRIVQPNLPDHAMEPRRVRSVLITFVLGLMAWGVLSLLLASIREHSDY